VLQNFNQLREAGLSMAESQQISKEANLAMSNDILHFNNLMVRNIAWMTENLKEIAEISERNDLTEPSKIDQAEMAKYGIILDHEEMAFNNLEFIIKRYSNAAYKEPFPITGDDLSSALAYILKKDKFSMISDIVSILDARQLDISSFNINLFSNTLEKNLNENFNAQNLLVILKFYTYFLKNKMRQYSVTPESLKALNATELQNISFLVFKGEDIFDMKGIFNLLVDKIGSQKIMNKATLQDLIDFYTINMLPFSRLSQNNH
jgi:hypothetical protein